MFIFQMSKYSRSKQKLILTAVGCMKTGNDCSIRSPHGKDLLYCADMCFPTLCCTSGNGIRTPFTYVFIFGYSLLPASITTFFVSNG